MWYDTNTANLQDRSRPRIFQPLRIIVVQLTFLPKLSVEYAIGKSFLRSIWLLQWSYPQIYMVLPNDALKFC